MKNYSSLSEIQADIQAEQVSCAQIVEYYLRNISAKNTELNAFLEVYPEEARLQAQLIDRKIKLGTAGKLAGLVVGLKDVLCHKSHRIQAASRILDGFISQFSATAVERLIQEDAIIIGRQNCDEFGMGSSNENSSFGLVKNAVNTDKVPGGSSGGSAVAVQADMCQVSLGSDTGGSVRQPAAFCGLVGLKPTYGRISRHGLIAYASSFDQIGILAKSAQDCAKVLEVISGPDEFDSTAAQDKPPVYSEKLGTPKKPLKLAYLANALESEGVEVAVADKFQEKLNWLKEEGHSVEPVTFKLLDYVLPTYYILTSAEASTNLSRYDGVRYGYRKQKISKLEEMYKQSRTKGFGAEVKRRIVLGTFVLSASYFDAYYKKAQKARRMIMEETNSLFSSYDFLLLPTTPTTAFSIGEHTKNPLEMYLADLFTVQASLCGLPAVSVPCGTDAHKMPIGMQVMASKFKEDRLLAFTQYLEKAGST